MRPTTDVPGPGETRLLGVLSGDERRIEGQVIVLRNPLCEKNKKNGGALRANNE